MTNPRTGKNPAATETIEQQSVRKPLQRVRNSGLQGRENLVGSLRRDQVDLCDALLHMRRCKKGRPRPTSCPCEKSRRCSGCGTELSRHSSLLPNGDGRSLPLRSGRLLPAPKGPEIAVFDSPVGAAPFTGYMLVNDGQDTRAIQQ